MKHDGNRILRGALAVAAALALTTAGTALAQPAPDPAPAEDPPAQEAPEGDADPAPEGEDTEAAADGDDAEAEPEPEAEPEHVAPAAAPVPLPPPVITPDPEPELEEEPLPEPTLSPLLQGEDGFESEGEVIVVTGSRIRTDPLDKPAPVLQITREELDRSGLTSVADFLQRLPVSGGALNTRFNSSGNFGFPPDGGGIGAGAAQADMRYLGSKRVLVLVDGVRWVNGSSASGVSASTDLNTIPMGIVERIEVLEDGASPIYGSDAIGGVINIITRKNWEGVMANAYIGGYHQGDGGTQQYDLTWGNKNERTSMMFSLSFVDQGRISSADRRISRTTVPYVDECIGRCSSGTPQGRFLFTDPNTDMPVDLTIIPGTGGVPRYSADNPGGVGDDFKPYELADGFNYAPFNFLLTPSRRVGVFSGVEHKVLPNVVVHTRALFNFRQSYNQAAPEPLFLGPQSGGSARMSNMVIHETNPYNPFGFTIDPSLNYFLGRRPLEAGPRIYEQNVSTLYLASGVRGDVKAGKSRLYWDVNAAFGINRADQIKTGGFNTAKLQKALGPLDECMAEPGCVPFNIFGGQGANGLGTITPEMLEYVSFVQKDVSEQQLFNVTANLSGDIVKLPAGYLSFAVGAEHRDQSGFYQPDAIIAAGDSSEVPSSALSGAFHVTEAYAETRLPILANMPGANLLDLGAAVRVSRYSTFGAHTALKAGARWRPSTELLVRGNIAQGFRAPGIGELYGAESRFDQSMTDPCSDMLGMHGGPRAPDDIIANCTALGVPEDGSYRQLNPQISVTTGGNLELKPETSQSMTASLVYSPSWLKSQSWVDGFDVELTYFRIELDGAIQALDAQVQLDLCVRSMDPVLCSGINRIGAGSIDGFANQLTNIGGIKTDGLDLQLTYLGPVMDIGRFRATSISSILRAFTEVIPSAEGFQDIERVGTEVGDPERAFPRFKSTLILDWFRREWRASWTARYIHNVTEPCRGLSAHGLCSRPNMEDDNLSTNVLSPTVYNDVQVTWTPRALDNLLDVTVGVNNLFNQAPPTCYSCALNGFDASTYDVPGMFAYVKAGYRMW